MATPPICSWVHSSPQAALLHLLYQPQPLACNILVLGVALMVDSVWLAMLVISCSIENVLREIENVPLKKHYVEPESIRGPTASSAQRALSMN
jgi:hypothetical protein